VRVALLAAIPLWAGATLLLAELRWFRRPSVAARLRPYLPGADPHRRTDRDGVLSVGSFREVVGPLATSIGAAAAQLAGVDEPVAARLARVHSTIDPTTFRLRQLGWTGAGTIAGAGFAVGLGLPPAAGLVAVLGGGVLGFLVVEHRLAARSAAWQASVFHELPVVAEQLGMLVAAGYSLGAGVHRLAARGSGAIGRDLQLVTARMRQGVAEVDALREWSARVGVDGADRLVAVLALNRDAGDLGRLVGDEARALRADVHRRLLEAIERRGQQVWIPVTVATLVPGVLLLAVPFVEALKAFSGG
jgi:tight adherence protein C